MGISDLIASFIREAMESTGETELQRTELAQRFNCVPSQINYVISTRFSPEHGYIVESRRGGGGYIRIRRVLPAEPHSLIMHALNSVGTEIDERTLRAIVSNLVSAGAADAAAARLILAAAGDSALRPVEPAGRNLVRASIFKQMLLKLE